VNQALSRPIPGRTPRRRWRPEERIMRADIHANPAVHAKSEVDIECVENIHFDGSARAAVSLFYVRGERHAFRRAISDTDQTRGAGDHIKGDRAAV